MNTKIKIMKEKTTTKPLDFSKVKELITKYKINQSMLADGLGLHPTTFCEKFKEQRYNKFSDEQKAKIVDILKNMSKTINTF